jgi:hypothetical protein
MTTDVIAETLDRLAPEQPFAADWEDVLRRAGETGRRKPWPRKRWLIAAAAAVIVALSPLAAIAAGDEWGLFRMLDPPATTPEVLQTGSWAGQGWELVGYRTEDGGLCFTVFSTDAPSSAWRGGPVGCSGSPEGHSRGRDGQGGIGYLRGVSKLDPRFIEVAPHFIAGPAIRGTQEVAIHLAGGEVIRTRAFGVPESMGDVVFFASPLPRTAVVEGVVGRAEDGRVIACLGPMCDRL